MDNKYFEDILTLFTRTDDYVSSVSSIKALMERLKYPYKRRDEIINILRNNGIAVSTEKENVKLKKKTNYIKTLKIEAHYWRNK